MTVIDCTQCPHCHAYYPATWSACNCPMSSNASNADATNPFAKKTLTDGQLTALVEKIRNA